MNLEATIDEAGKVVKRQKTCATKTDAALNKMIELVQAAQRQLEEGGPDCADPEALLQRLQQSIEDAGLLKEMNSSTKEFHTAIAKLGKALEKAFDLEADVCKALRPVSMDQATLCQVIAEHLYRQGRFDLGDALCVEAGLMGGEALRQPYAAMHEVLEQIKARNLEPALRWAVEHRQQLAAAEGPGGALMAAAAAAAGQGEAGSAAAAAAAVPVPPSAFEFQLHSLNFIHTLQTSGKAAALSYAKQHFGPHAARHLRDIQRLMGCLVFAPPPRTTHTDPHGAATTSTTTTSSTCMREAQQGQGQQQSADGGGGSSSAAGAGAGAGGSEAGGGGGGGHPYADLMAPAAWDAAAREFARLACSLMGQASESPLTTAVAAGYVALPPLLKLAGVMERNGQDLRSVDQLPVEIELGPDFVFRSIFACPVSRDSSAPDNPPMLLPCGHVLCEQSVQRLAKQRSRYGGYGGSSFKCPYCPQEAKLDGLRPITFPDMA